MFLLSGSGSRDLDAETRTLVERGGGEYEAFDVSGGPVRLRQALERNKRKAQRGMTVVGDVRTLESAAADVWTE